MFDLPGLRKVANLSELVPKQNVNILNVIHRFGTNIFKFIKPLLPEEV